MRKLPRVFEKFPTSRFDSGHSTLGRTQMEASQVHPRWFGQDLPDAPDSGISHTQDNRTSRNNVGWCDQSAYQPTDSQPIGCKRRAGDRLETRLVIDRGVRREGAQRGTPRKRALFSPEGPNGFYSGGHGAEAQAGWPPDDEYPMVAQSGWPSEDSRSPEVELVDAVARLQKDLAEFRMEFGYGSASRPASSPQTTRRSGFTSTSVPKYTGRSSWDQYRQVFEAIVCSNRWDGVTAVLQLVSHLEGDALNIAQLVPESQRVLPVILVGALSEHYGSPGRLAEYKRQFKRASRSPGDDPSVFAIELETLTRRAFADVNASVRLQLVRDRFIARQAECFLHRHLDSVGPDTHMRDIVDSCRMWESYAEVANSWGGGQRPESPRGVYQVVEDSQPNVASEEVDLLDR